MSRIHHRVRAYDEATGQVYDETQVPVTSMVSAWPYKCNGKKQRPQDYRHRGRGSSSLFDTAIRSCAWNIDAFEPSDLQCVDWHFAKMIYYQLQKNQNLTANAWSTFQQAFPGEVELNHTYSIRIPAMHGEATTELPSIQQWLKVLPFTHMSMLNIQDLCLRLPDLMILTSLPNLGVLLLRHPHGNSPQDLDDKAMRDWGRAVQEKGSFTRLRVVGIHYFAPTLQATLKCLSSFPALRICTVETYYPIPSVRFAESQVVSAGLPFELFPDGTHIVNGNPEAIWSRGGVSSKSREQEEDRDEWKSQRPRRRPFCCFWRPDTRAVLTKGSISYGTTKMEQLYNIPETENPQQHTENATDSAVLSVHYGAERTFAYSPYPLWFRRLRNDLRASKHRNNDEKGPSNMGNSNKKRKMRQGKQSDIGAILGGFM